MRSMRICECCGGENETSRTKLTINYPIRPLDVDSPMHQISYIICDKCREKVDDYLNELRRQNHD